MEKMMTIRPPDELRKAVKAIAKKRGHTVNQLVNQILWDFVDEEQKKGEKRANQPTA